MDQNKKNSIKNFFRKEGFYLILFICLCLVATVAVVTAKNTSKDEDKQENQFSLNIDENVSETQKQNAERVENEIEEVAEEDSEVVEGETTEVVVEPEENTVPVGTTIEVEFRNPLDGELSRAYTYPVPQKLADGTHRNIRGIDIKSTVGTEVRAAAIGEVKEVKTSSEDGVYVVISHPNGLFTKYSNLSKEARVNVGDKVTEETVIGTVGDTSGIFTNAEFGEHLNFQIFDSNGKDLDPTEYFQ